MSLPRTPQLVQEAKRLRLENGDLRGHNAHLQEDNTRLVHKQNELLLTISTLQDAHMKLQEARIRQLESGQAAAVARPAAPAAPAITPSRKRKAGGVERVSVTMSAGARQQAQAEGLTLRVADNGTGYFGVCLAFPGQPRPYKARVRRDGKRVHLGSFATAEEAALCVARSLEGRAVAARAAAAAESQGMPPTVPSGTSGKEERVVPPMPPDAFVKVEVVV